MYLIDSFVWASEPPWAIEVVVIETSENPSILPDRVNALAPLASALFETMYSNLTILPSSMMVILLD